MEAERAHEKPCKGRAAPVEGEGVVSEEGEQEALLGREEEEEGSIPATGSSSGHAQEEVDEGPGEGPSTHGFLPTAAAEEVHAGWEEKEDSPVALCISLNDPGDGQSTPAEPPAMSGKDASTQTAMDQAAQCGAPAAVEERVERLEAAFTTVLIQRVDWLEARVNLMFDCLQRVGLMGIPHQLPH